MKTVSDLLQHKGHDIWSLKPDATVYEAIELMAKKSCGALVVMEDEKPVGIISERDYARKVTLKGKASRDTEIREVMSHPVFSANHDQSFEEVMVIMTEKRIRHLPVLQNEKVIGVISIGDVVRAIIEDKENTINQLKDYIGS